MKKQRRLLTNDEKIARHVAKHNAKEIAAVPLFADQISELEKKGVIHLKTETGFKQWLEYREAKALEHQQAQMLRAKRYAEWVLARNPDIYALEQAEHQRKAIRAPSLLQPHYLADHWWQVIRKNWGDLQARIVWRNDEVLGRIEWERVGCLP